MLAPRSQIWKAPSPRQGGQQLMGKMVRLVNVRGSGWIRWGESICSDVVPKPHTQGTCCPIPDYGPALNSMILTARSR